MSDEMQALFEEHVGLALSRQRDLTARIGDWRWDFAMDQGTMTFGKAGLFGFGGKQIVSECQVLGTESESQGTWLWSWANTQSGIPSPLLRAAEALRERGARDGVPELTERSIDLEEWDGHRIAMIASGLSGDCAGYYRGPYPGGALFVLLTGPTLVTPVDKPVLRFVSIGPELLAGFTITDHRRAARGLARGLGLRVEEGESWTVSGPDGAAKISFDAHGRITNIGAQVR
jgi:hypothetical protein